jgi:SAM-dependent methyltransferase
MRPIDVYGFEKKFRENIDPWNYAHSPFERFKRTILLRACGHYMHGRGLEIGCAIGETTHHLARICLSLVALDGSATALNEARRRLGANSNVRFVNATVPEQMPAGPFDLIVISEIAYYLPQHKLTKLGRKAIGALAPHGRVVILHHRRAFDDAAQLPRLAHQRLYRQLNKKLQMVFTVIYPRFDVAAFKKASFQSVGYGDRGRGGARRHRRSGVKPQHREGSNS